MTSLQILSEVRRRGIELQAVGDSLRFRSMQAVPPELLSAIRTHRTELLEMLRLPEDGGQTRPRAKPPGSTGPARSRKDAGTPPGQSPVVEPAICSPYQPTDRTRLQTIYASVFFCTEKRPREVVLGSVGAPLALARSAPTDPLVTLLMLDSPFRTLL